MTTAGSDDMHRHPSVEQQCLMGTAQVMEAEPFEAELPRAPDKAATHSMRITWPRDIEAGASRGGKDQRALGALDERQVDSGPIRCIS